MKPALTLQEIFTLAGGEILHGDPRAAEPAFTGISTDTRQIRPGMLFIALRGDRFDGHQFLRQAFQSGAVGALVENPALPLPADLPDSGLLIRVASTLEALQTIAAAHRARLPMKTVGVTGSNGKTSAKELTAAVLSVRYRVAKSLGNLNNHIGVPLSLLNAGPQHEYGVFEAGMNHRGEIAPLAAMIAPDIAIITNIGVAHIENLGSRDAIFEEKTALPRALKNGGALIYDAEDDYAGRLAAVPASSRLTTGFEKGDIRAACVRPSGCGTTFNLILPGAEPVPVFLPLPGAHMVRNALLAAAAGVIAGLSPAEIAAGLAAVSLPGGRLEIRRHNGLTIIDDSYNANPDSVRAAIGALKQLAGPARKILVLGDMGELGAFAAEGHRLAGEAAAGLDAVITAGGLSAAASQEAARHGVPLTRHAATPEDAARFLAPILKPGDFVLVKGSRSARMERFIQALTS